MAAARKRAGTVSVHPPPTPSLKPGSLKTVTLWVQESGIPVDVVLNPDCWPGVTNGDLILVTNANRHAETSGYLFQYRADLHTKHGAVGILVSKTVASTFGLSSRSEVVLKKVAPSQVAAEYIEVFFRDQYLGRSDMWLTSRGLEGKCLYVDQKLNVTGCAGATVKAMYSNGHRVTSAFVTPSSKIVYRSMSAKSTIFIQVCQELWDFAEDGERYYEKIVHSFLPSLVSRWNVLSTNHVVTVVLISRVYYDQSEVEYAAGPLRTDDTGNSYKDFFKVVVDHDLVKDWSETLVVLKQSFWDFQRDILFTHHYHRPSEAKEEEPSPRLVGRLSFAHNGPILEALNLGLNPTETHYIDRSLALTGSSTIVITPGTGHFNVSKDLLRLTTSRILDQGFGLDLVSLSKSPLHRTPVFKFKSLVTPSPLRPDRDMWGNKDVDPLWLPDAKEGISKEFWWEPFWVCVSFWDYQWDLPIRVDRFVPRAKMYEIQMLGLLEHDVVSAITIPPLEELVEMGQVDASGGWYGGKRNPRESRKLAREQYDTDTFAPKKPPVPVSTPFMNNRYSMASSGGGSGSGTSTLANSMVRTHSGGSDAPDMLRRISNSSAVSNTSTLRLSNPREIHPIEEKKEKERERDIEREQEREREKARAREMKRGEERKKEKVKGLERQVETAKSRSPLPALRPPREPTPDPKTPSASSSSITVLRRSPSPSNASIRSSSTTGKSTSSRRTASRAQTTAGPFAKLSASFLLNAFRAAPSQPEASPVSVARHDNNFERTSAAKAAALSARPKPQLLMARKVSAPVVTKPIPATAALSNQINPAPIAIRGTPFAVGSSLGASSRHPTFADKDSSIAAPGSVRRSSPLSSAVRASPLSSSPHDDHVMMLRRRSLAPSINPSRPNSNIPHSQASLARRWQHTFPRPVFQHLIKWKSICTPACLPLTIEYYPPETELMSSYQVYEYDILVAGIDMSASFMLRKPNEAAGEDWPLLIMREMAALRLAQGFQFIVAPFGQESVLEILDPATQLRRLLDSPALTSGKAYSTFPLGASDVLKTTKHPVYLSMSNQIHVLEYKEMEQVVKVQRYVRRTTHSTQPYEYTCLVWPKLGDGYTEVEATFNFPSLELYGWNRMDMLIAGYQQDFTDSLRYWRTRFLVIPSLTPPPPMHAPSGERLSEEEVRLLGIDKLAELFTKARWVPHDVPDAAPAPAPAAVRFLPTWLEPSLSVLDDTLMAQLEQIHADGPLRKNTKHDRNLEDASLAVVAKAMREDPPDGVPFKDYTWQKVSYLDSFTGFEFVSWLVREWRDVSTREQGVEWGTRLLERGLFEHCRGHHGFLDGHYFYHLRGDYSPAPWLLRSPSQNSQDLSENQSEASQLSEKAIAPPRSKTSSPAKNSKRRLVMSQTMIIDVDMNTDSTQRSDRAQSVILHHDIIHNPAIAFHFEINWIGTTARCIDDMLQMWSRTIERYGLKLVEAYVDEIIDIRRQNIFQSTFPVPLCIPPPPLPAGSTSQDPQYYETAILRHFGFILDIEAANRYSNTVDVFYSYRRKKFTHSQFVHKTGLAFVQIVGGKEGFRWLTNRLFVASNSRSGQTKTNTTADELRVELFEFCMDRERVKAFYEDVTLQLQTV